MQRFDPEPVGIDMSGPEPGIPGAAARASEAGPPAAGAQTAAPGKAAAHDGQHDFDPLIGTWKYHLKRLKDRLAGSHDWVEFDGTSVTRKVWGGRAQLEEFETGSADGHIEGLTLRTYDPETREWRLYWANSSNGVMDPPQIGEFTNGVGEFYATDTWKGKSVLVRFIWSKTDTPVPHFEQSYSTDGGKTWEVNWITDQTRVAEEGVQ